MLLFNKKTVIIVQEVKKYHKNFHLYNRKQRRRSRDLCKRIIVSVRYFQKKPNRSAGD